MTGEKSVFIKHWLPRKKWSVKNSYLATYPPCGPMPPIWAGGGPPPPTPPSSPPRQTASSSLKSLDLKKKYGIYDGLQFRRKIYFDVLNRLKLISKRREQPWSLKLLFLTHFFQNFGKIPQHNSMPFKAFSAICISWLMESIPASTLSNCSIEDFGGRKVKRKRKRDN